MSVGEPGEQHSCRHATYPTDSCGASLRSHRRADRRPRLEGALAGASQGVIAAEDDDAHRNTTVAVWYRVISYLRRYDLIQFAPQTTQRR